VNAEGIRFCALPAINYELPLQQSAVSKKQVKVQAKVKQTPERGVLSLRSRRVWRIVIASGARRFVIASPQGVAIPSFEIATSLRSSR
jgi:hypothetical protein